MDRKSEEFSGDVERQPRNPQLRAHMAHTAFAGMQLERMHGYLQHGPDFYAPSLLTADANRQLTPAEIAGLPDFFTVNENDLGPPTSLPVTRSLRGQDTEHVRVASVMRQRADRLEAALGGEHADGPWGDNNDIAKAVGIKVAIVHQFISRNRSRLGSQFPAPEMRRRVTDGRETTTITEHFSPQFVAWAIASLRTSLERHQLMRQIDAQLTEE